jgi:type VI secretion system secreted protein Hcp
MKARVLLLAALFVINLSVRAAAVDYFLKIEGVPGESVDADHRGEIEVLSWSFGVSNPVSVGAGGQTAGKATFQDFQIMKSLDKSTPLLMKACAKGTHIPQAILFVRKATATGTPVTYYKVTMEECMVSSYQISAPNGGDRPSESLSLNFTKITFDYTPYDANGRPLEPVIFGWDVINNVEL